MGCITFARLISILFVTTALGCAHHSSIILSVTGLDCYDCAEEFLPRIRAEPGVREATFDRQRVEITVRANVTVSPEKLVGIVEAAGYHATIGSGHGAYLAGVPFPSGADVAVSSRKGEDIPDLASLAVPGKITVIDFYAEWCGPCREVDKHMAHLLSTRADLAMRKLNVVDWDTPLARHYLAEAPEIPYQIVLDRKGHRAATISGLHLDKLDEAINAAMGAR